MGFWKNRWDDIRGNLMWAVLYWMFGGGFLAALAQGIRYWRGHPFGWKFTVVAFIVSTLGLAIATLIADRLKKPKSQQQQPATQTALSTIIPTPALPNLDTTQYFRSAYFSPITAEVEKNIKLAAAQNQPHDKEGFLAKFIGVGLVSYLHDLTWAYIYRSQILMLMELNRRNGMMPSGDAKAYYDQAARDYPQVYANYSFDQWLTYMVANRLLIRHPSDMLEITFMGKDFLKYLTHWGRYPDARMF